MTQPLTLREARSARRPSLTQVELADRADVDQTYVSLIERGLRTPSNEIKIRLAKALGIAPSRLRFSEPDPDRKSVAAVDDRAGHDAGRLA